MGPTTHVTALRLSWYLSQQLWPIEMSGKDGLTSHGVADVAFARAHIDDQACPFSGHVRHNLEEAVSSMEVTRHHVWSEVPRSEPRRPGMYQPVEAYHLLNLAAAKRLVSDV